MPCPLYIDLRFLPSETTFLKDAKKYLHANSGCNRLICKSSQVYTCSHFPSAMLPYVILQLGPRLVANVCMMDWMRMRLLYSFIITNCPVAFKV
jgi:hypothetical protein